MLGLTAFRSTGIPVLTLLVLLYLYRGTIGSCLIDNFLMDTLYFIIVLHIG
jgi:hypothetical protein